VFDLTGDPWDRVAHGSANMVCNGNPADLVLSARSELADDVCPVRDELVGELHRANDLYVPDFVYSLAPEVRASLALFCYRRSHLHSIGLAIAASCDKDSLVWAGGSVGAFVFACSRQATPRAVQSARADSRKITLSTGVLRMFADEDDDDDDVALEPPTDALPLVEMVSSQV
jgi:hypothetical protein